jgi:hypothetical protein
MEIAQKVEVVFMNVVSQQCTDSLGALHKDIPEQAQHSTGFSPPLFIIFSN